MVAGSRNGRDLAVETGDQRGTERVKRTIAAFETMYGIVVEPL